MDELTPEVIAQCCEADDEIAKEAFRLMGSQLGLGMANYATLVNPEAIILAGEMNIYSKWFLPALEQSFDEHVFGNIRNQVKLLVSEMDNSERDALGASALAWTVKEYSLFK